MGGFCQCSVLESSCCESLPTGSIVLPGKTLLKIFYVSRIARCNLARKQEKQALNWHVICLCYLGSLKQLLLHMLASLGSLSVCIFTGQRQ